MTNKEDGDESTDRNPRMAALLAVHLVSQVLNEAYNIANDARDSGQPWHYLSLVKSFKSRSDTQDECQIFKASNSDYDGHENKMETVAKVATSTPQKILREPRSEEIVGPISESDTSRIGQGDEDLDMQSEIGTSTLINRLFDMSDVERDLPPNPINSTTKIFPNHAEKYSISQVMQQIYGTYIEQQSFNGYPDSLPDVALPSVKMNEEFSEVQNPKPHDSDYSLLSDAYGADINRDVAFYIDDDTPYLEKESPYMTNDDCEIDEPNRKEQPLEVQDVNNQDTTQKNVVLYEDAYATLNRDYDQCSEDGFPILQDPKGMIMQEVELMTASISEDDIIASYTQVGLGSEREHFTKKDKESAPEMIASPSYKNTTLTRRFRNQGSRLFSCFRGMWRRGTSKSKDCSVIRINQQVLSPEVRHRNSSLVTKSNQRSHSPLPRKYNTINEATLRLGQLKEYTSAGISGSSITTSLLHDSFHYK